MTVHQHAASNRAAAMILDCFEAVNREIPITGMRWQIAHIENAADDTLARMKALNMGWSVQDRLLYSGQVSRCWDRKHPSALRRSRQG